MVRVLTGNESRLHEQMADKIATLIVTGTLRPGERVPSVRRFSQQHNVSVSTVLQAYLTLENRGFIAARPQSGYYVRPRLDALPPEPVMIEPPAGTSHVTV